MALKALGVPQESMFYFVNGWKNPRGILLEDGQEFCSCQELLQHRRIAHERAAGIDFVSAFTDGELGVLLPERIYSCKLLKDEYAAGFFNTIDLSRAKPIPFEEFDVIPTTEAEARAAYLIYLLSEEVIPISDIINKSNPNSYETM
jgi:hypothetical protein